MKKTIRLTESDLHKIIKNTVKRVLKESESIGMDEDLLARFDALKENLGADAFCDELMRKMGQDLLKQILPQIEREWEMKSEQYLNSDEDYENQKDWHFDEQGYYDDEDD